MKEKIQQEKSCENCLQHYIKFNGRIRKVPCGHCIHSKMKNHKIKPLDLCAYWEDLSPKISERKSSIRETLFVMAERLSEISIILQDDEE